MASAQRRSANACASFTNSALYGAGSSRRFPINSRRNEAVGRETNNAAHVAFPRQVCPAVPCGENGDRLGHEEFAPDWLRPAQRTNLERATAYIGKAFGDRNAMKAIVEVSQMWPKLQADAQKTFEAAQQYIKLADWYREHSFDAQKQGIWSQFENIGATLGAANVDPFTAILKKIVDSLCDFNQWLSGFDQAKLALLGDTLKYVAVGLGALGATALVASIAALAGPAGLIAGLAAALDTLVAVNWNAIISGIKGFVSFPDGPDDLTRRLGQPVVPRRHESRRWPAQTEPELCAAWAWWREGNPGQ
jgi:hypothetical protein